METFFLVLHIILSFVIVIVILLQSGKGGGLGAGFSSAAAMGQEVFGGRGAASFLGKLTVVLGAAFMITSMTLAWYSSKPQSILDLQQEAEDAVDTQVHEIIDEGSAANVPPDPDRDQGAMSPPAIDVDGDDPFQIEVDGDAADIDEEMRRQLEEQFGAEFSGDVEELELPTIPEQEDGEEDESPVPAADDEPAADEPASVDEPAEPAQVDEPAEPEVSPEPEEEESAAPAEGPASDDQSSEEPAEE